jgi:hypothetical protein
MTTRRFCCLSITLFACSPDPQDIGDEGGGTTADADDGGDASPTSSASMSSTATAADDDSAGTGTANDTTNETTDPSADSDGSGDTGDETGSSDGATTGTSDAALVVFVAFDGATLVDGAEDDSTNDVSTIWSGNWPVYGEGAKREAVLAAVQSDWADFAVTVTDERQADGDYVMILVGPGQIVPGGLGIAPIDCGDQNRRNIAFVQTSIGDALSIDITAAAISRHAAHTLGLEEVAAGADMMAAMWEVADPEFTDECLARETSMCAAIDVGCPDPNAQNAHAALLAIVGPS